eukprot:TRINITY_DN54490_c0_g1_i1.p1 TRINITY_DN54490_c0_g1~~TRINITY_DN54490_c0_g1_i1.p1  ORF type:complete len:1230 (-),score=202.60 TRINITY_DN54490_c0_g1_i1:497-4186(-)
MGAASSGINGCHVPAVMVFLQLLCRRGFTFLIALVLLSDVCRSQRVPDLPSSIHLRSSVGGQVGEGDYGGSGLASARRGQGVEGRAGNRERRADEGGSTEALRRRSPKVVVTEPEWFLERGQLPAPQLGRMFLREVVVSHRRTPWRLRHARIDDAAHRRLRHVDSTGTPLQSERFGGDGSVGSAREGHDTKKSDVEVALLRHRPPRRLTGSLGDVINTPLPPFKSPRDGIRFLLSLNVAAVPWSMYDPVVTDFKDQWGSVYAEQAEIFYPARDDESPLPSSVERYAREVQHLKEAATELKKRIGADWKLDAFEGMREPDCADRLTNLSMSQVRCARDVGVSLAVYEDATTKVIVFVGGHGLDWNYTVWREKLSIMETMQKQIQQQWSKDAAQKLTADQKARAGSQMDELNHRCGFMDYPHSQWPDKKKLLEGTFLGISDWTEATFANTVNPEDLWFVVMKMVRVLLPTDRDMVSEKSKLVVFTGSGLGGSHAALTSMWLKTVDAESYYTYVFAPNGFHCSAQTRYSKFIDSTATQTHIRSYRHIMDGFAALGGVSGKVCLYGRKNFTPGTNVYKFCERIVGHTGPQLFYSGPRIVPPGRARGSSIVEPLVFNTYLTTVEEGAKAMKACHYFTHSPWYAAMLFADPDVLLSDGTTEGGCYLEESVAAGDPYEICPRSTLATRDCDNVLATLVALPKEAMVGVMGFIIGFIILASGVGFCCLKSVNVNAWIYGNDNVSGPDELRANLAYWCPCFISAKKLRCKVDRAREARLRSRKAREQKFLKEMEKQSVLKSGTFVTGRPFVAVKERVQGNSDRRVDEMEEFMDEIAAHENPYVAEVDTLWIEMHFARFRCLDSCCAAHPACICEVISSDDRPPIVVESPSSVEASKPVWNFKAKLPPIGTSDCIRIRVEDRKFGGKNFGKCMGYCNIPAHIVLPVGLVQTRFDLFDEESLKRTANSISISVCVEKGVEAEEEARQELIPKSEAAVAEEEGIQCSTSLQTLNEDITIFSDRDDFDDDYLEVTPVKSDILVTSSVPEELGNFQLEGEGDALVIASLPELPETILLGSDGDVLLTASLPAPPENVQPTNDGDLTASLPRLGDDVPSTNEGDAPLTASVHTLHDNLPHENECDPLLFSESLPSQHKTTGHAGTEGKNSNHVKAVSSSNKLAKLKRAVKKAKDPNHKRASGERPSPIGSGDTSSNSASMSSSSSSRSRCQDISQSPHFTSSQK